MTTRLELGVNIDHVATLRQVRYRGMLHSPNAEPDVVQAAHLAEQGGADQITVHLRQDRRHIQDQDVWRLRDHIRTRLNLEMGNTAEIIAIALDLRPWSVCLVPEHRQEVTTEGGLDVAGNQRALLETVQRCRDAGIRVSLFIDPELDQIEAAAAVKAEMVELHTGAFANAPSPARRDEMVKLAQAARLAFRAGLQVNAGHGLSTQNLEELFGVPHLTELNIGHHLVCRALEIGLRAAVSEMRALMDRYPVLV
ncbi:MAG: pyridoxine 5'-phosphate synthase [Verrucomicrobiales bacterium]